MGKNRGALLFFAFKDVWATAWKHVFAAPLLALLKDDMSSTFPRRSL